MKKHNAEVGEKKRRLNWFDLLLIGALALGITAGAFCIFYFRQAPDRASGRVVYTLMLSGIESSGGKIPFTEGELVKNANGTLELGKIVSVQREKHLIPGVKNGRVVFIASSVYEDLYVTVSSKAQHRGADGIRVGDIRIAAGERMSLRLGAFAHNGAEIASVIWEDWDETDATGAD